MNLYEDNNLVFCTDLGKLVDGRNLLKRYKKVLKKTNISEDKTIHSLRHTFATRLFENGEQVPTVKELLGHSRVETTLNIYTHVMNDIKENAVAKLNDIF